LLSEINDNGTTIIMVTHEANLAMRASRNILVHDGEVSTNDPALHIAAQTA
jgi:putative ABC transport system ATP-binding protein